MFTWNERALDAIAAVQKDRTVDRVRASQCSSTLVDHARRMVQRAAADPGTPSDSPVWTWVAPGDAFPWAVRS